jgi:hypothetical protein
MKREQKNRYCVSISMLGCEARTFIVPMTPKEASSIKGLLANIKKFGQGMAYEVMETACCLKDHRALSKYIVNLEFQSRKFRDGLITGLSLGHGGKS